MGQMRTDLNQITDVYTDPIKSGRVIGSLASNGTIRRGVDKEGVIGIDNGALRIQPLIRPGWGRASIVYGPYERQNGLALTFFALNGHNTSQSEALPEGLLRRLWRWARGTETESVLHRLLRWLLVPQKRFMLKRLIWWLYSHPKFVPEPAIDENLVLGWFPSEAPQDPVNAGNTFTVHAGGPRNGELWTRVRGRHQVVLTSLQNIPVYYMIILREQGAAYYASSLSGALGLIGYPYMRPLAIDTSCKNTDVYAALHQSVLGQIGFRVDTRVYATQIKQIPDLMSWYGTAHMADSLQGEGALAGSMTETGDMWIVGSGGFQRTHQGAKPVGTNNLAIVDSGVPSGLIHLLIEAASAREEVRILWRYQDVNNYCSVTIGSDSCHIGIQENGIWCNIASDKTRYLCADRTNSLQILDDGHTFTLYWNGETLFDQQFVENRLQYATAVGIHTFAQSDTLWVRNFEVHARSIPIPQDLNIGCPWKKEGQREVIAEDFIGAAGDLAGKITTVGAKVWRKEIGLGNIHLTGAGSAKVQATATDPAPGRIAYTVEWDYPQLADIEIGIVPPGTAKGQNERGRGGVIFWQDERNYITVSTWLDDNYSGSSISSFFYLSGYEELYDAVWTNVDRRVHWGRHYRLRVAFDGVNYLAYVDDEPVLYRALTDVYPKLRPLTIHRVGLVANWEWGCDTGSVFTGFTAKT